MKSQIGKSLIFFESCGSLLFEKFDINSLKKFSNLGKMFDKTCVFEKRNFRKKTHFKLFDVCFSETFEIGFIVS